QLTSVTLGRGITSINEDAFAGNKITAITIPDNVTELRGGTFFDNPITKVVIGDKVEHSSFPSPWWGWVSPIGNEFTSFYDDSKQQAGTYTYNERTKKWTGVFR
ncbi:MAG: leucine-rich repeat domain-containing protein, partial [Spirochaetales bacterium]|nr:leucine-rich repeat domain-containing protein [Spirochaetales bacterium]